MRDTPSTPAGLVEPATFDRLFGARTVALVGASETSRFARVALTNLETSGFDGAIELVHRRHEHQFGRRCRASLTDVPGPVDVAYVLTGHGALEHVLAECAEKGVAWAVVLAGGYAETGVEGRARQEQLIRMAADRGVSVLGPNALGFLNARSGLAAYGNPIAQPLLQGPVGLVSQSGGMAVQLHRRAVQRGIGIAKMASLGNSALTTPCDLIEYLVSDDETHVIGCLLETLDAPDRFRAAAQRALDADKPLVVLKIGRSEASARSVVAHIGALAGEDRIVDGFLRQLGVLRVRSPEELVETCGLLAARGWPAGPGTAVVTTSGGASGIAADLAVGTRVELPELLPRTAGALDDVLEGHALAQNPLDITGFLAVDPGALARVAAVVANDPAVDAVVTVLEPPREPGALAELRLGMARGVTDAVKAARKYSVLTSGLSSELTDEGRRAVAEHGLHYGDGLAATVAALDHAIGFAGARARRDARARRRSDASRVSALQPAIAHGTRLTEHDALEIVAAAGIRVPRRALVGDADEAAAAASQIGFPVVVKVQSPDVPHKTEAGGVRLGVASAEDARSAYDSVLTSVARARPEADVQGVLVVEQVSAIAELLLGFVYDPTFGPVVTLAAGGILAELLDEAAVRVAPVDVVEAEAMLAELRFRRLIQGFRGKPRGDTEAVIRAVVAVSELALALEGGVRELELNPLLVLPEGAGVVASDALIVLAETR